MFICIVSHGHMNNNYVLVCYLLNQNLENYVFCYECNQIYPGDDVFRIIEEHPNHDNKSGLELPGVYIKPDFISFDEEKNLMNGIDGMSWDTSQSGRRKQVKICE